MQNGVPVLAESESQLGTEDESEEAEGKKAASEDTDGDSEEKSAADADSNEEKNTAEERSSKENADESEEKSAAEETSTENAGDEKSSAEESAEEKNSNEESSNEESSEEKSSIEESSKEESADKESSTESASDEKGSTEESTEEKESSTEETTTEVTSETESGTEETATEETTEEEEEKNVAESTNAEGGNILANGSFEVTETTSDTKWVGGNRPSSYNNLWASSSNADYKGQELIRFSVEVNSEIDGNNVLHIKSTNDSGNDSSKERWSMAQGKLKVDTSKAYKCTFWAKADEVTGTGCYLVLKRANSQGTTQAENTQSDKISNTNGWKKYEFTTDFEFQSGDLLQLDIIVATHFS